MSPPIALGLPETLHPPAASEPLGCGLAARLENARFRRRIYAGMAVLFFVLACVTQGMKSVRNHEAFDFVVSDGEGYWVYMPALAVDGNLDFSPQIRFHATVHSIETGSLPKIEGKLLNHWPAGVAMTLSPTFILAHGVSHGLYALTGSSWFIPNGYSILYQLFCLSFIVFWVWVGFAVADGLIVQHFRGQGLSLSGWAIVAGMLCYGLGTNYAYYAFREPVMAHAISATWVILAVDAASRILVNLKRGKLIGWQWGIVVFSASIAVCCRYTDAFLLPLAVYVLIATARAGCLGRLLRLAPLIVAAMFPLVLQVLTLRLMSGRMMASTSMSHMGYDNREGFRWLHPAPFLTLFSSNHGLFFWSPVLLLAVWGFVWYLRLPRKRADGLTVSLLIGFAMLWYLNSAWWAWWFGKSFGARSFVDIAVVFMIGMVLGFQSLQSWNSRGGVIGRRLVLGAVGLGLLVHFALLALFIGQKIPRQGPLWGGRPEVVVAKAAS